MFRKVIGACVGLVMMGLAGTVNASVIYDYAGNEFAFVFGTVAAGDNLTGFVEFSSVPTPSETFKTDITSFSFTGGALTLADTTPGLLSAFSFNFDINLEIITWGLALILDDTTFVPRIRTCSTLGVSLIITNVVCFPSSEFDDAISDGNEGFVGADAGTWTRRVASVPEPASLPLFLVALAALALLQRLTRPGRAHDINLP